MSDGVTEHSQSMVNSKMVVLYRLEPGCLGPDGIDHIEIFSGIQSIYILNQEISFDQS